MKTHYDVIQTLVRTEKGVGLESDRQYLFRVAKDANKIEIRKAVEAIYSVKVEAVNTVVVPGKPKRIRQEWGHSSAWKKAMVTLKEGNKIDQ